ncbi:MAG: site-specific integrase [Labilithrix sp.]|nr:site-specific integrase [Labilithrix sp.]
MPRSARPTKHGDRWRIRWLDHTGKRQSDVFDTYKQADQELRRHQAEVEEVKRGLRAPPAPEKKSVGDALDYWLDNRAPQKRSGGDDESIIKCHLRPSFGHLLLRELGVQHTDAFVAQRAALNAKTVHNHLTLFISVLNAAVDLGWLAKVPRIKKPKVRIFSADYRYVRTVEERDKFLRAAHDDGEHVFALYSTAVFTGMREGELAALHWDDVDFDKRLITVQRSFEGPTKAEDVRYVPILDALLPTLRAWRLRCSGKLVFPNRDGRMLLPSSRIFQEVLHRVLKRAGFPKRERRGASRSYIVFHDLRHTFASHWMMHGGDLFKLQKILGHKTVAMTMRYAHLAPHAFTEDHGRFGVVALAPAPVRAMNG